MSEFLALVSSPAGVAILISVVFAFVNSAIMILLFIRRRAAERKADIEKKSDIEITRLLLRLIQNDPAEEDLGDLAHIDKNQLRRLFNYLMKLVRGSEYDRLLYLSDILELPDAAIRQLGHRLAARRVDALRVLEQFPVQRSIDALIERMGVDECDSVRLEAATALARLQKLPPPHDIVPMLGLEYKPLNRLHEAIFRTCAATYTEDLVALTRDADLVHVRPLLVEALGWSQDFSVMPILAEHAGDTDAETRSAALKAARQLGHPAVGPWVVRLLRDPVDHVRSQAARTAGKLEIRDACPQLRMLLDDASWWVRKHASDALEKLDRLDQGPGLKGNRL